MTLGEVKRRLEELNAEYVKLFQRSQKEGTEAYIERFREITDEIAALKEQQEAISEQLRKNAAVQERVIQTKAALENVNHHITEWIEETIRQLVHHGQCH